MQKKEMPLMHLNALHLRSETAKKNNVRRMQAPFAFYQIHMLPKIQVGQLRGLLYLPYQLAAHCYSVYASGDHCREQHFKISETALWFNDICKITTLC